MTTLIRTLVSTISLSGRLTYLLEFPLDNGNHGFGLFVR